MSPTSSTSCGCAAAPRGFRGAHRGRPRGRRLRSVGSGLQRLRQGPLRPLRAISRRTPFTHRRRSGHRPARPSLTLPRCRRPAIHSRTSSVCAARSTSCSVTFGAARAWPDRRAFSPPVDVYYRGDPPKAVIKVELAGVEPDDVSLEVRGRVLMISGERRPRDTEGRAYQQIEIGHGPFERQIELGVDVGPRGAALPTRTGSCLWSFHWRDPRESARQVQIDRPRTSGRRRSRDRGHPGDRLEDDTAARADRTCPTRCRSCRCGTSSRSRTR